ncbi:LytTR family DNA-binding domain-containing protein [Pseudonocardia dioxanivorans]|uniref:LytTR family DNA-binding domain-containing protein n=1 Tax=Pseudonocardia dioxanivorans TaxID=240495 RepID=UPI00131A50E8|nr:LytTR family DNA-binding domain-containing protein [Pseudonocardia dioxanivorans]
MTDGHGQIIAAWSDDRLREDANNSNLEPQFCWAEATAGTNGMGMALVLNRIVAVRGPEHWRADMHEWNCLAAAVSDPVLGEAAAALNISSRSEETVLRLAHRLRDELAVVSRHLAAQAARDAATVKRACARAEHRRSGIVIGLDLGGAVVAGGQEVRRRSGGAVEVEALRSVARDGLAAVMAGSNWRTAFVPGPPLARPDEQFEVQLVEGPAGPAGWLVSRADHSVATSAHTASAAGAADRPGRVPAESERCVLLLDPGEIRFAEAQGHTVWLITDRGRLRARTRGIDNVERQLAEHGFLRVHRSFLVNPDRVRRIDQKGNGVIALSTDPCRSEDIPVARRSTLAVRRVLGLSSVSTHR